ncbi:MAG: DUF1572 domain-containing protein [Gemmatimonadota bacterium]|nr:DUF1572 domain-containing protein [Gemmatimonadota bacterium]
MTSLAPSLLTDARDFLRADYLPKIVQCLDVLSEEDVWWRANDQSNSIGNLLLHLEGSTRKWILIVAGGQPLTRDRDAEFAERGPIAKSALLTRLRSTLTVVDEVLATLDETKLLERRPASNDEEVTVLWAVLHAIEHFAMHTGQIILITKLRTKSAVHLSD